MLLHMHWNTVAHVDWSYFLSFSFRPCLWSSCLLFLRPTSSSLWVLLWQRGYFMCPVWASVFLLHMDSRLSHIKGECFFQTDVTSLNLIKLQPVYYLKNIKKSKQITHTPVPHGNINNRTHNFLLLWTHVLLEQAVTTMLRVTPILSGYNFAHCIP